MSKRCTKFFASLFLLVLLGAGALMAQEIEARVVVKSGPWLGLYLADVEDENGWQDKEGALVKEVIKHGPAEEAGVRQGDIIIRMQDRTVRDADDVTRDVRKMKPGDEVQMQVLRDGKKINLKARLQERKVKSQQIGPIKPFEHLDSLEHLPAFFSLGSNRLGIHVQEMDPDLADYFSVKEGDGVLVTRVEDESAAAEAGLKSGDVITAMNGKSVSRPSDITRALEKSESAELEITYLRKGSTEKTVAKIPREQSERRMRRLRVNDNDWPLDKETMEELKVQLNKLKEEMKDLKIKLNIEVEGN